MWSTQVGSSLTCHSGSRLQPKIQWRYDIQYNDTQHNDKFGETQDNTYVIQSGNLFTVMLGVVILSVVARLQVIYWYKVAATDKHSSLVHLNKAYRSKKF